MSSTLNPEQSSYPSSYKLYFENKSSRLRVQKQGKETASNVSFLYRQAKNSARELNQTTMTLMELYSKRISQFDNQRKKSAYKRMQEDKLREMKNVSSLNRYLHSLKKEENTREVLRRNHLSAKVVKEQHRHSQEKMRSLKANELHNLRARNQAESRMRKMRNQCSRQQSLRNKRKLSATVHGTLREKQSTLTQREIHKIRDLSRKQEELLQIVERSKKQKEKLQEQLQKGKQLPADQLYGEVMHLGKKMRSSRRKPRSPF